MKPILRRIAIGLGVVAALIIVAAVAVYFVSQSHFAHSYTIAAESIPIPTDSLSIAKGEHLVRAIAKCADCHTPSLAGQVFFDNGPMGKLIAPNLTRGKGGIASQMKDEDWIRAIRHGVAPDGRPLLIMPSFEFNQLSTEDLGAILAYVKSVPPVDHEPEAGAHIGPVARALVAAGKMPMISAELIDHSRHPVAVAPAVAATKEYGDYIVHVGGCAACHGPTLAGGHIAVGPPDWPPAANLTPTGMKAYDEAKFISVLRTGVRADGTKIKDPMPIAWTKEMTDDEIKAVWAYLKTVPPREFGAR